MSKSWAPVDHYFSGQGVVLVGKRDAAGKPAGLRPVGNVSALSLAIATTTINHKEAHSGGRGVDKRLSTDVSSTLTMVLESFNGENLEFVLRAEKVDAAAVTGATETLTAYLGLVTPLGALSVSNFVLKKGTQALTEYTTEDAPYDYDVNLVMGSFKLNDGSKVANVNLNAPVALTPTAVTVGATTSITVANTLKSGDTVTFTGFTGADASSLNGVTIPVATANSAGFTVAIDTSTKTITVAAGTRATLAAAALGDSVVVIATYDAAAQEVVNAMSGLNQEVFMRFEGLNTAEENEPVIVEVFKFSSDPLAELALISDTIGQFSLTGSVLADTARADGSLYFRVIKLASAA